MNFSDLKIMLRMFRHDWIAVGVFLVALTYYLSLLHLNIANAHDAPEYYRRITVMQVSWHAHHVLYEPLSFLWLEYGKLIFPDIHPFKLVSSMNSFFGAASVSLVYLITVKRLDFSVLKALICCLTIGGSFYYLNYATTVEVYHSALFFMLATFYHATKKTQITFTDAMIIGILHGVAMSFHQMHFLLGIVLAPRLFKAGYLQFFIYILYGTIIVITTYALACYAEHIHSFKGFVAYFIGYMGDERMIRESSSPILAPLGFGMALLGGRYIMAIEPFKSFIRNYFSDSLFERIFYLHHKTDVISGYVQIALYCVFFACFLWVMKEFIKTMTVKFFKADIEYYGLIAAYSLFFTFWYSHNPEFWGVAMTFTIIIILSHINNIALLAVIAVAVLAINLFGTGLPLLDPNNNLYQNGIDSLFFNIY